MNNNPQLKTAAIKMKKINCAYMGDRERKRKNKTE